MTRARSDRKWCTSAIYRKELLFLFFQVLINSKCLSASSWVMNCFHHATQPVTEYCYFHGKWSDDLHSLVPVVLTFSAKKRNTAHLLSNHLFPFHIPLVRCEFHSNNIFPRTVSLWKRSLRRFYPDRYNLNLFNSWVNRRHPHISP